MTKATEIAKKEIKNLNDYVKHINKDYHSTHISLPMADLRALCEAVCDSEVWFKRLRLKYGDNEIGIVADEWLKKHASVK